MDKGELVGPIAEQVDDNLLASTRDKNTMKWIGDRTCSQCSAAGSEAGGVSLTSVRHGHREVKEQQVSHQDSQL